MTINDFRLSSRRLAMAKHKMGSISPTSVIIAEAEVGVTNHSSSSSELIINPCGHLSSCYEVEEHDAEIEKDLKLRRSKIESSCLMAKDNNMIRSADCVMRKMEQHSYIPTSTVPPLRNFTTFLGAGYGDAQITEKHGRPLLSRLSPTPTSPFSPFKTSPSKWEDAEKWVIKVESPAFVGINRNEVKANMKERGERYAAQTSKRDKMGVDFDVRRVRRRVRGSRSLHLRSSRDFKDTTNLHQAVDKISKGNEIRVKNGGKAATIDMASAVALRDIGTDMTPVASSRASGYASASPNAPTSTSPTPYNTPTGPSRSHSKTGLDTNGSEYHMPLKLDLHEKNMLSWNSREQEDKDIGRSLKHDEQGILNIDDKACTSQEIECRKCINRYKYVEEMIQRWEDREKARAKAALERLEVKLEKMRIETREKIMKRVREAERRAGEERAAAEAKKVEEMAKIVQRRRRNKSSRRKLMLCGLFKEFFYLDT